MWIGVPPATWNHLGKLVLTAAGIDSADESEIKDSYLEVLKQSLGGFAQHLGGELGREVCCAAGNENAPAAPREQFWVAPGSGDDAPPPFCIQFGAPKPPWSRPPRMSSNETSRSFPGGHTGPSTCSWTWNCP
jgi:hypothetical protein